MSEPVAIKRAHRLGRPTPPGAIGPKTKQPRPIIVKFLDYRQRDVIRAARVHLKHPLGIAEDLPFEVRKARKSLTPELRELKQRGKKCSIVWPAPLLCDGKIVREADETKFCRK